MVYAPGTLETDPKKQNMSLQQNAKANATNAANIATNTTNIATNASAITALQTTVTSSSTFGLAKVDGTTIAAASGVISTVNPLPSPIHASLGADVTLNNTANYFDGPSIAQGATGTWFVSGQVTVFDTAAAASFDAKLWDGTTVIASGYATTGGANFGLVIALSGWISSPAGNLKISVKDQSFTTGKIAFNTSGNSKDSTISAYRIA